MTLSRRDEFAKAALQGLLAEPSDDLFSIASGLAGGVMSNFPDHVSEAMYPQRAAALDMIEQMKKVPK